MSETIRGINRALNPKQCQRCKRTFQPSGLQNVYCSGMCRHADLSKNQRMRYDERMAAKEQTQAKLLRLGINPTERKNIECAKVGDERKQDCTHYYGTCVNFAARADWRDFSCGQCKGYSK